MKLTQPFRYRLGLDLGTNSLGWAILELDDDLKPCKVARLGVRIFDSGRKPKDGTSKAVDRRGPRQMRRRQDRYLRRRQRFIDALVRNGLMPEAEGDRQKLVSKNPWRLRSEAVSKELEPYEVGRALFHLQQRRGFKSNRRVDRGADNEKETSGLKGAINAFHEVLGDRTVGQELWDRIQRGEPGRARKIGAGQSERYAFYVDREMVAHEFDAIWAAQSAYRPELFTEQARVELRDVLLFQRDLLPQTPGSCFYIRTEARVPIAFETAQLFRLYQEVNNLRLKDLRTLETRPLTRTERDQIVQVLLGVRESKLTALRKKVLGAAAPGFQFTLETENRPALKGNQTRALLAKPDLFGARWDQFSLDERDAIAELVAFESNERLLVDRLQTEFDCDQAQAERIAQVHLPDAHLRIGQTAARRILEQLEHGWNEAEDAALTYDKAVIAAGFISHSEGGTGEVFDSLPYYGEVLYQYTAPMPKSSVPEEAQFGKIGNPTVHLGLNQVRKVVNAIIKRYGVPTQIVLEVSRDLKNGLYTKSQIERDNKDGRERNERYARQLEELSLPNTNENRTRLRLYEELSSPKQCVYSGRPISVAQLFSNEIQIDHILPMSRTLDNGISNKLLSHHSANRFKGNRSPYEAFGSSPSGYSWDEILERAKDLPAHKFKRFSPEAVPEVDGFLDRQLVDNQYLARVSRQYLSKLTDVDVWVTPGRLTGMLRGKWGLNSIISVNGVKNRSDHRHHAIDAAVIAVTDRSLLQRVSTVAARAVEQDLDSTFDGFPDPWPGFRSEVAAKVYRIVVSHKPDHGSGGALHNDTAYGIVRAAEAGKPSVVHHRVAITDLKPSDLERMKAPNADLWVIDVSPAFRAMISEVFDLAVTDKERQVALETLASETGRKSVRRREPLSVIPIFRKGESALTGDEPYKAYKGDGNYCYEIFEGEKGRWDGRVVSRFEANSNAYKAFQKSPRFRTHAWGGEPLVMRLLANDCVVFDADSTVYRVQGISDGVVTFAPSSEANVDARNRDKNETFKYTYKSPNSMKASRGRRVLVDELGTVRDPGFRG